MYIQRKNVRNCLYDYSFIYKFTLHKLEIIDRADCTGYKITHRLPVIWWFFSILPKNNNSYVLKNFLTSTRRLLGITRPHIGLQPIL